MTIVKGYEIKPDADLIGANLIGADLTRADLTGANLKGANLSGADLNIAILTDANLTGANLERAFLAGANLINANLTGADLTSADLTGADLAGANLRRADLTGANLTDANLYGANLDGAIYNNLTIIEDKFKLKMYYGLNITVKSEYNNRMVTYTFETDPKPNQKFIIQYAFKKNSSAYSIMKKLPDGYDTLIFGKNVQKITKTFKLKEDAKISKDQKLDIRIKESKGKITNINRQQFKTNYDFQTTIPKNTSLGNDDILPDTDMAGEMDQPMTNSSISLDTEYNTTVGYNAFNENKGKNNTSVGSKSMETTTINSKVNTALGYQALNNVTNLRNIGIGVNAGKNTKNGSNNILIGKNSDVTINKSKDIYGRNQIVIGNDAKVDDNSILINQKNILPGNNKFNLGDQKYKFDKLYSNKIRNGDFELKLPINEIKGDRYLEVDNEGNIKLVSLKDILSNL